MGKFYTPTEINAVSIISFYLCVLGVLDLWNILGPMRIFLIRCVELLTFI